MLFRNHLRVIVARHCRRYLSQANGEFIKSHDDKMTHFGDETVSEEIKTEKVYNVFRNVAKSYDVMNDVMSVGIHRLWKDILVSRLYPMPGIKHLDVASGTGDVAIRILQYVRNEEGENRSSARSTVVASDINENMLRLFREKTTVLGYSEGLEFAIADAEKLPFPDDSFDSYTVAFGIRNCTRIDKALQEAYRVLRVGGRFLCLEFSRVDNAVMRWFYDQYSYQVIPVLGQVLARDWKSYQYLVESIRRFPHQEQFKEMIEDAGFCNTTYENLTFGIVSIHSGFKL